MIGANLLRFNTEQRYLMWDVETEGLNLFTSRPWEISYAICTAKAIESIVVRRLNWPNLRVSDEAARITRFNMADHLKRAEDPMVVLKDFESLALDEQYLPAGHNIMGFDGYVYRTWRRALGLPDDISLHHRFIDTNCLFKGYKKGFVPTGDRFVYQWKLLNYREKGLKSSLGVCCREFGIPYDERQAHDAKYDTQVNHAVLKELIWKIEI